MPHIYAVQASIVATAEHDEFQSPHLDKKGILLLPAIVG